MPVRFEHGAFASLAEVLDDIKRNGTWPTTYVSGPSPGLDPHWHSEEVHAYVMEGETDFFDADTGQRTPVKAGDKVIVPARTVHAEGAVKDKTIYLIAVPAPQGPEDFLRMREPKTL
ncbi:MAG: cupin domain-containing protein [Hyphomonadaceae bacterium]